MRRGTWPALQTSTCRTTNYILILMHTVTIKRSTSTIQSSLGVHSSILNIMRGVAKVLTKQSNVMAARPTLHVHVHACI